MGMAEVTVRELRNMGGKVLKRVARGERLIVTMDGRPVAELRPIARKSLSAEVLIERRRNVPTMDVASLRADLDSIMDSQV